MGDTHRRIGRVDMLSARARGAIGVDLEVALVDLNLDIVVDHRIDPDARKARVAARRAVVGRDSDEAVDAAFGLGLAIGILALHKHRRRLDARLFASLRSEEHTSELQSIMRISYAVFFLKKKRRS